MTFLGELSLMYTYVICDFSFLCLILELNANVETHDKNLSGEFRGILHIFQIKHSAIFYC